MKAEKIRLKVKYILAYFFFFFIIIGIFISNNCYSQIKKKYKTDNFVLDSSKSVQVFEFNLDFTNINKTFFYQNQTELSEIYRYDRLKSYTKVLPRLEEYVSKFGIQNFYKETHLVWRLGQLYELFGYKDKAQALFRIVLKHHRGEIDKIQRYYDSVTVNDKDYYVPLKHYYELVEFRKSVDTLFPPKGVLTSMGNLVNSKMADYGPSMNFERNQLYFTSKRNTHGTVNQVANEDIFYTILYDEFWDEAQPLKEINTRYNEGSPCITKSGKKIFFSRCNAPEGYGDCDIYMSEMKENGSWGPAKNLGSQVNSKGWDSHPSLSHSEDTLYFASDKIGGFGLSDIYFTVKSVDSLWGPAQNAGPVVNSRNSEVSPFIHPVYDVLYFSSRGQILGFGDFDIYKSLWTGKSWGEPKNIGPLVNGKGSEYYFTIDSKSKNLFYARSEEDNLQNLDIYSFPLPMEAQPLATTKFEGQLLDTMTNDPFHGIVTIVDLSQGIEVAPKFLRPDGSFDFDLINNNEYMLIIQGKDFFRIQRKFTLNGDTSFVIKAPSVNFKRLQFTSVEFETGRAEIRPVMHDDLDKIFNYLVDNPELKLLISGHTDSDGDSVQHVTLSQNRADAIKSYIVTNDLVDPDRVLAIGFGNSKPIIKEEKSEEDKKVNRRVEFGIFRIEDDNAFYELKNKLKENKIKRN